MTSAKVIYQAAQRGMDNFVKDFYGPNMRWLEEVCQEALRIFNEPSSPAFLLPRTPGVKRKCVNVDKANSLQQYESTFHDAAENKKLKIDDLSLIVDCSYGASNTSRTLRARKARVTSQPKTRTNRHAAIKSTQKTKSLFEKVFILVENNSPDNISSHPTKVQPKVFALIESMKMVPHTTPNAGSKNDRKGVNMEKLYNDIKGDNCEDISFTETPLQKKINSPSRKILTRNTLSRDPADVVDNPCTNELVNDTIEPVASNQNVCTSTPEVLETIQVGILESSTPLNTSFDPTDKDVTITEIATTPIATSFGQLKDCSPLLDTSLGRQNDASPLSDKSPLPEKSPKLLKLCHDPMITDKEKDVCEEVGRRDTWRIVVSNIIDNSEMPPPHLDKIPICDMNKQNRIDERSKDVAKKTPKIVKPIQGGPAFGNVIPNLKKIIKKNTDSPKQAESDNQAVNKAAEIEKKELLRQKNIEELQKKKQKQIEEKKRQREEREKEFAAKHQQLQQEEEFRRKQLQMKEAQMAKNREEIRKARELEERKKRELRDVKKAELFARRQKEEEERKRKVDEQIRDEKRKRDILQRKNELDEQKRLEEIAEKDILGKGKLRQHEESRLLDEERKKVEFSMREKHRLEVEKKKKEEKEKERLDRQAREEQNMQAEKDVLDWKKRVREVAKAKEDERVREVAKAKEDERQRAKEKIRAEIDYKFNINKPVSQVLRSSPRLKVKYNAPVVPLVQRDSIYVSYDIDDLDSEDSTDDESQPEKPVPSWAVGARLKKQLTSQFFTNIDAAEIFVHCMEPLRLDKIFNRNKTRYFKRTSSAQWGSPPIKAIHKYRK